MKIKSIHSWNVSPGEAVQIQKRLAEQVKIAPLPREPEIIAGADIGWINGSPVRAFAGVVLMEFPSLRVVGEIIREGEIDFPYVPGLLSFREAPLLLELFKTLSPAPDLVFFDGHGIAHPRRLGLASHLGLFLNCPTVGCAKSKLIGNYMELDDSKGSFSSLKNSGGQVLGAAVRSRQGCKPIFISAGHLIDLDDAIRWTLHCVTRYRIPEPTRLAHNLVAQYKREALS